MAGYHDDDPCIRVEIPHLRYTVWYSNSVIIPQHIASFYTVKMAEDFIGECDLPAGHYAVKDVVTGKDVSTNSILP